MLQIEECGVLLCLVRPPIVELDGLLDGPVCKEWGHFSEDFVYVVGGGGASEFWVSLEYLASSVLEIECFSMDHFLLKVGF